jgi:ribosomal protein S4
MRDPAEFAEFTHLREPSDFSGAGGAFQPIRIDKLLHALSLTSSISEASRKIKERGVIVDGVVAEKPYVVIEGNREVRDAITGKLVHRLTVRVGKRAKIAIIE